MDSLKSAVETEDHVPLAEDIDPINVAPHQGQPKHKSASLLKVPHPYSYLKKIRWTRAEHLPHWHAENGHKNILFKDKKIFTIEEQYSHQSNKIYAQTFREVK